MNVPQTRLTVSSLLIGGLILCAAPQTASAKKDVGESQAVERMVQSCFNSPAPEALAACEWITGVIARAPNSPNDLGIRIQARLRDVLSELGRYGEAEVPARKAVAVARESNDLLALAAQQHDLAIVLYRLGRFGEAENLLRSAIGLATQKIGAEHPQVAKLTADLAVVLKDQGRLEESESLLRKSLNTQQKMLGPEHPELATTLNNLAVVLQVRGHLEDAESLFRRSLNSQQKMLGLEHPDVAMSLGNLAGVLRDQGKLDEAESLLRKSLAISEKALGPAHPKIARSLGNLAGLLEFKGKLDEAESLLRKSLAISEKALGPEHPELAPTLNNLAGVLKNQGKFGEAESLLRKSLAISEKALGPEHPELAPTLNNLAGLHQTQGKLDEAASLLRRSLAIVEKTQGPEHPSFAEGLQNLALVLMSQDQPSGAEPLLQRALAIQARRFGSEDSSVATTMGNLGLVLARLGRQAEAETYLTKSMLILTKANVRRSLTEQGQRNLELVRVGKVNQTRPFSAVQYSIGQPLVARMPETVTEGMADVLLAQHEPNERLVYGLPLLQAAPPEAGLLALRTSLMMKAQTQGAGKDLRDLRRLLTTGKQKEKYQTMLDLLTQRDLVLASIRHDNKANREAASLLRQAQQIYWDLAEQHKADLQNGRISESIIISAVAKALPSHSVLVEIGLGVKADFGKDSAREIAATLELHYVALILWSSGSVRVVDLGEKESVNGTVQTFLGELQIPRATACKPAQTAYDVLFAKLESVLEPGTKQVIVSSDGALSIVPWGALHDGKRYLVDQLSFQYITSGRELLNQPSRKPTTQPAVMMATRVSGQVALTEAEKVGKSLAQTLGAKLTEQSTDGQVLTQQSPSVLTLISHGYFGDGDKEADTSARLPAQLLANVKMGNQRDAAPQAKLVMAEKEKTEELMHDSGLMMMPGSQASTDTKQDGRLTAVEVREMNLQGTKLVMLLACKGAAGGLSFGQGVYGLRRAVLQAGAETVVGTLWSVEEKSASELAKKYMTKLWTDKKATRVGAMEEAMKEMRRDPRYSHPHYWAPFVVMGMDGPLGN